MNKKARWIIAASMVGAGAAMGIKMARNANQPMKRMRRNAASMASNAGHQAGDFISNMGDNLADKIR